MERVVTINLNGVAYQLETPAYDALRAYLDRAEAALSGNPDKGEIVSDLEQAIADKCAARLGPGKNVVTAAEMSAVLGEMGPVEGDQDPPAPNGAQTESEARAPRRLYRLKEGAVIDGVCAGLGAYFDIDANLMRVLWVVGAIFTGGLLVLGYIVLMFVIPAANTAEEWAAAHGAPFNAQEVIDGAKKRYRDFQDRGGWRQWEWARNAEVKIRAEIRRDRRRRAEFTAPPPPATPATYATQIIAGLFALILGLIGAALTIAFVLAVFSLATTGAVFGFLPPIAIPFWLALVVLTIVYATIALPFAALRRASFRAMSGRRGRHDEDDGVMGSVIVIGLVIWALWAWVPETRPFFEQMRDWTQTNIQGAMQ